MELNFDGFEMPKKYTNGQAQRQDEKNKVICLTIMFTSGFIVVNDSFFVLFAVTVWA